VPLVNPPLDSGSVEEAASSDQFEIIEAVNSTDVLVTTVSALLTVGPYRSEKSIEHIVVW